MNQDNYNIDKIFSRRGEVTEDQLLKYANDELTDSEAHEIELLLVDSDFHQDAVDGMSMIPAGEFEAMKARINASIDARVAASREEEGIVIPLHSEGTPADSQAQPRSGRNLYRLFSIAASVMLLAVAGYFFLRPNLTPGDIADQNFEVYEGNVLRGGNRSGNALAEATVYDRANKLYNERKFDQAASLFDQVDSIQARYLSANCYYVLGKYELAADRFRAVIALGDGYAEDAEFGLAMTMLKQDKVDDARSLLEKMAADQRHNYHLKAQEARDQLENL